MKKAEQVEPINTLLLQQEIVKWKNQPSEMTQHCLSFAGLIAAGVALYKNWDKVKEKLSELWGNIKEKFNAIKETITGAFTKAKEAVTNKVKEIGDNKKTAQ